MAASAGRMVRRVVKPGTMAFRQARRVALFMFLFLGVRGLDVVNG
jgi:hypothetical protein